MFSFRLKEGFYMWGLILLKVEMNNGARFLEFPVPASLHILETFRVLEEFKVGGRQELWDFFSCGCCSCSKERAWCGLGRAQASTRSSVSDACLDYWRRGKEPPQENLLVIC